MRSRGSSWQRFRRHTQQHGRLNNTVASVPPSGLPLRIRVAKVEVTVLTWPELGGLRFTQRKRCHNTLEIQITATGQEKGDMRWYWRDTDQNRLDHAKNSLSSPKSRHIALQKTVRVSRMLVAYGSPATIVRVERCFSHIKSGAKVSVLKACPRMKKKWSREATSGL